MARLSPGARLKSAVCDTQVMVIATPEADVALTCGGAAMLDLDQDGAGAIDPDAKGGSQIGKRYVNEAGDLELLCTKPGEGTLAADGVALRLKEAKALPSSD
jgi:hypothetical protein